MNLQISPTNFVAVTDPGFGQGGGTSSDPPEKCIIWASEYNLGPQKWGERGAQAPVPQDPLLCRSRICPGAPALVHLKNV